MNTFTFSKHSRTRWNWSRWALLSVAVCGSSCSSASQYVKHAFQKDDAAVAKSEEEAKKTDKSDDKVNHAYTAKKKGDGKVEPLNGEDKAGRSGDAKIASKSPDAKSPAKPGEDKAAKDAAEKKTASKDAGAPDSTPPAAKPKVAPAKDEDKPERSKAIAAIDDPFANAGIQQTSVETPAEAAASAQAPQDCPPIQHPLEPRQPLDNPFASIAACPPSAPCAARPFPGSEVQGDEYVCDGGDKGISVHVDQGRRAGLDPEDTVAEFKDDEGKSHVQPSTETCVYAPRFASVRSATQPQTGLTVDKLAGHQDQLAGAGMQAKTVLDEKIQSDEPQGMLMRSRPSGLEAQSTEDHLHQAIRPERHVKLANAFEDIRFIQEGQFDRASSAVIVDGVTAAQEWADGRRPIIIAHDEAGQVVQGKFAAEDYTGVEDRRKPGELKLIKVADRGSAHPGDIVTFTIRFDNVGDRELRDIRVIDNLSPRLDYIEGSVSSSLDGQIDVDDNAVGGKLLTFEFEQPLKGRTGGYVSFQCRVR
jgi:uncharacterized repeat protein (TIGR01451 family)